MKLVQLLAAAEQEAAEAAMFYEQQAEGLGAEFLDEFGRVLRAIREFPEAGAPVEGGARRRMLSRFPYGVIYRVDPEEIVVLSVMHLRRRPGYWLDRT